jgi:hypothetical protein
MTTISFPQQNENTNYSAQPTENMEHRKRVETAIHKKMLDSTIKSFKNLDENDRYHAFFWNENHTLEEMIEIKKNGKTISILGLIHSNSFYEGRELFTLANDKPLSEEDKIFIVRTINSFNIESICAHILEELSIVRLGDKLIHSSKIDSEKSFSDNSQNEHISYTTKERDSRDFQIQNSKISNLTLVNLGRISVLKDCTSDKVSICKSTIHLIDNIEVDSLILYDCNIHEIKNIKANHFRIDSQLEKPMGVFTGVGEDSELDLSQINDHTKYFETISVDKLIVHMDTPFDYILEKFISKEWQFENVCFHSEERSKVFNKTLLKLKHVNKLDVKKVNS